MIEIIKRHNNKNQYLLTNHGYWVRDFTKSVYPLDINHFIVESDYKRLVENELRIASMNLAPIDLEYIQTPNVVIVSDGHGFVEKRHFLKNLPRNVTIIGTNRSLANWLKELRMDYFVVNNPFKECMSYFSTIGYFPRCVTSCRTYYDFVRRYRINRGLLYRYTPVKDKYYGGVSEGVYYIDDYRNPICAAVGLAYRWGVKKLLLFCCDDAFDDERPGSMKLENCLYMYPQHEIGHEIIDANLYWLKHQEFNSVKVVNFSNGPDYKNASYIPEDEISSFFTNGI